MFLAPLQTLGNRRHSLSCHISYLVSAVRNVALAVSVHVSSTYSLVLGPATLIACKTLDVGGPATHLFVFKSEVVYHRHDNTLMVL